jgi:hypothetical protein
VKGKKGISDQGIIDLQNKPSWRAGIWGRLQGSNWVLFSHDTAPISVAPYLDATARLDALPLVPALDPGVA